MSLLFRAAIHLQMSSMADSEEKEESGIPAVTKDTVTPATAEEKDGVGKRKAEAQAAGSGGKAARYTAGQGPASGNLILIFTIVYHNAKFGVDSYRN